MHERGAVHQLYRGCRSCDGGRLRFTCSCGDRDQELASLITQLLDFAAGLANYKDAILNSLDSVSVLS